MCREDGTPSSELVQAIFDQDVANVTRVLDEHPQLANSLVSHCAKEHRSWKQGLLGRSVSEWPSGDSQWKRMFIVEPAVVFAVRAHACKLGAYYLHTLPSTTIQIITLLVERGATVDHEATWQSQNPENRRRWSESAVITTGSLQDNPAVIELLTRAGANPLGQGHAYMGSLETAIDVAAEYGAYQSLGWLLDYALSKGQTIDTYVAPLHEAARYGSASVIQEFLKRGAGKLINTKVWSRFLRDSILPSEREPGPYEQGQTLLASVLLHDISPNRVLDVQERQRTWLTDESTARRERLAWILLDKGATTNARHAKSNKTLLYGACMWASSRLVSHLINTSDYDLMETFEKPPFSKSVFGTSKVAFKAGGSKVGYLHIAAFYMNAEAVNTLMLRGLTHQIDEYKRTPLHWLALSWREYTQAGWFCEHQEDDGQKHAPAIAIKTATYLLDNGQDINAQDSFGRTPLHYVCRSLMIELLVFLLSRDADINLKDCEGRTPLHVLTSEAKGLDHVFGDDEFPVERMSGCLGAYKRHIDINAQDDLGLTPLHQACKVHAVNITKFLLAIGADPNIPDKDSQTPLHHAVTFPEWAQQYHWLQNRHDVHRMTKELKGDLVAAGADETRRDNQGRSVAEAELAEMLRNEQKVLEVKRMEEAAKASLGRGRGRPPQIYGGSAARPT